MSLRDQILEIQSYIREHILFIIQFKKFTSNTHFMYEKTNRKKKSKKQLEQWELYEVVFGALEDLGGREETKVMIKES